MNITSFKVSQDKSSLQLFLENATGVTSLRLWTHKTYKIEGLEIDLSSKLNGANIQSITITLADLDITYFDGVYFVEIGDGTDTVCGIAEELTRYKECVIEKVLAQRKCDSCISIEDKGTMDAHVLMRTLNLALELKLKQEILIAVFALDKFCTNTCNSCGEYKNI